MLLIDVSDIIRALISPSDARSRAMFLIEKYQ